MQEIVSGQRESNDLWIVAHQCVRAYGLATWNQIGHRQQCLAARAQAIAESTGRMDSGKFCVHSHLHSVVDRVKSHTGKNASGEGAQRAQLGLM